MMSTASVACIFHFTTVYISCPLSHIHFCFQWYQEKGMMTSFSGGHSKWSFIVNCFFIVVNGLIKATKLQWRTKILGAIVENLASTSLTYQIIICSIICTCLNTLIPRMALPFPSKQCWDEEMLSENSKVYRAAQTTTLLGSGEGGKGGRTKGTLC